MIFIMKTKVAISRTKKDIGTPGKYTRAQLDIVKSMIKDVADGSVGGMKNIVKEGDVVLIKINTVVPSDPASGFTTDPRMLEALIELVKEQKPKKIQIGERSALGLDTLESMRICGIVDVAERTGCELVPFEKHEFKMYKIDRPIPFNEFPVPKAVVDCDVYIGLPKMKVHIHTHITNAMKLQFGNLPDYAWMAKNHCDDIYYKISNLTKAANPTWFVVDSLYACEGNGPFSPYPQDLIKDFNVTYAGTDPVAVDTVCEALMDWEEPGSAPSTVMGAADGLGTNNMDEIEIVGTPIDQVKRRFKKHSQVMHGKFPNVRIFGSSASEPGCKALVRMNLDALQVQGVLKKLKRPLNIFLGAQSEIFKDLEGDVIVFGEFARGMLEYYPNAKFYGSTSEYPGESPIWCNVGGIGMQDYVKSLVN